MQKFLYLCKYKNKLENEFKNDDLEILIATMNRDSLDFLNRIFPFSPFHTFNLLIVNQTNETKQLSSDYPNVKVINVFGRGLSKSRNIALRKATGKIILIADDDVVYPDGFQETIIKAYNKNKTVPVICFQTLTTEGKPFSRYQKTPFFFNINNLNKVLSIEVTAQLDDLRKQDCFYNEWFGLGARFQDAETLFFLRRALKSGLQVLFFPENIVIHKQYSSSDEVASDRLIYAKMAGFYKRFGIKAYYYLVKYMFFLWRKRLVPISGIRSKFTIGLKGIKEYKEILKKNEDTLYG
ncbi:glycosyltransferase family 2 protein [Flavobacterium cerinum]|uniref:Glycosyltransferase n=1 Tax=Flavobacterium cerinum TaxID=2502784 RepID=A0ABY5IT34_9FLAO|nr:glycosyltransferase [Flavobacterium cerinum]UUC45476.1 glycosyltransferase [Flavobacterium cerinum]